MIPELKDLLEKYADTRATLAIDERAVERRPAVPDSFLASLASVRKRKSDLEREISELWGSAEEAGPARSRQQAEEMKRQRDELSEEMERCHRLLDVHYGESLETTSLDTLEDRLERLLAEIKTS